MLDVRLKALDYMMNKAFPEEMLMGKMELQPRRFQRNEQLQSRWLEAQHVLVMQETLVYLTAAREHRRKNRVRRRTCRRRRSSSSSGSRTKKWRRRWRRLLLSTCRTAGWRHNRCWSCRRRWSTSLYSVGTAGGQDE